LMQIAEILVAKYEGKVPESEQELVKLPGIGIKSAHVILNVCFQKPLIAVDTHVFRVSHRMGLADASTPDAVTVQLQESIPLQYRRRASHWLVLHGRYVCKARKPLCANCRVRNWCSYPVS
jgi:endonuclease III